MTHAQLLADTYDATRFLTNRFWKRIRETNADLTARAEVNGKKLNCPLWIYAHLGWTENHLLRRCMGDESVSIPWLQTFKFGSDGSVDASWPSVDVIESDIQSLHTSTLEFLNSISDGELANDNAIGFEIIGRRDKLRVIQHAIRHEAMHCGQLNWLWNLSK